MRIWTGLGDDGSTGTLLGGRVGKDDPVVELMGAVDEAVSALGVARALNDGDERLASYLLALQRGLFVVGADVVSAPGARDRLEPGVSVVTADMVAELESAIDTLTAERPLRPAFVVPGENLASATLDLARTAVRRAERRLVSVGRWRDDGVPGPALVYLNRASDLLYVLARRAAPADEPLSHDAAG
ncbi:cob(I)yrinic acid a,c-diamide adenosyltransferase [Ornithinimicrobium avium]|uniref:cob(I)yrinic acid a,c-diamide adenosyltransferase n=1 Tax=Ornithinimicrobium avium TaxID=2283195 RepID=UPI0013B430D8|nr:cob(I)yrinic acid a,c-diamide adenosyltransferase [Ornithinimicrobium avium]